MGHMRVGVGWRVMIVLQRARSVTGISPVLRRSCIHPLIHTTVTAGRFLEMMITHDGPGHRRIDPLQLRQKIVGCGILVDLRRHVVFLEVMGRNLMWELVFWKILRFRFVCWMNLKNPKINESVRVECNFTK